MRSIRIMSKARWESSGSFLRSAQVLAFITYGAKPGTRGTKTMQKALAWIKAKYAIAETWVAANPKKATVIIAVIASALLFKALF